MKTINHVVAALALFTGMAVTIIFFGLDTLQNDIGSLQSQVNSLQKPKTTLTAATSTTPNPLVLTCLPHEAEPLQMFDGYGAPIVTGACYGNALTAWGANMAVMTKVYGTGITWSPWTPRQAAHIEKDPSVLSCVNGNNDWIAAGQYGIRVFHCSDSHWVR